MIALGIGVFASGVGIDLLFIAGVGLFLLVLERTLGDWMGEKAGSGPAAVVFTLVVVGFTWYVLNSSDSFFAAAEQRGYRGVYYRSAGVPAASVDDVSDSSGTARAPSAAASVAETEIRTDAQVPRDDRTVNDRETHSSNHQPEERAATGSGDSKPKSQTTGNAIASRVVFGAAVDPPAPARTTIDLSIAPASVPPGRRVVFQGVVRAQERRIAEGSVEFVVDGVGFRKVPIDTGGVATTEYSNPFPGAYEVRARFSGSSRYAPSLSDVHTFHVVQH